MASITVRNIPQELLDKLKTRSSIERRSLNNEILVVLERGTYREYEERIHRQKYLSRSTQKELWESLLGSWEDSRSTEEIIKDIYSHRTTGRDVKL